MTTDTAAAVSRLQLIRKGHAPNLVYPDRPLNDPVPVLQDLWAVAELYFRLSSLQETRDAIVPDLRDFKWLDPECHAGCQSLRFKGERDEDHATLRNFLSQNGRRDGDPKRPIGAVIAYCESLEAKAQQAERERDETGITTSHIAQYGFRHTGESEGYQLWERDEGSIEVATNGTAFFLTVNSGYVTVGQPKTMGEFRTWMRLLSVPLPPTKETGQ